MTITPDLSFAEHSRFDEGAAVISERDKEVITTFLIGGVSQADLALSGLQHASYGVWREHWPLETIDQVCVEMFSDEGKNKRVFLVEVSGRFLSYQDSASILPFLVHSIPTIVIDKLRQRLEKEEWAVERAIIGECRHFILKVARAMPADLQENDEGIYDWTPPTQREVRRGADLISPRFTS